MPTKAKPSLLQQAAKISPPRSLDWLDRLDPTQRAEVTELLQAKLDGRLSIGRDVLVKLLEDNGIKVSNTGIRRAMLKLKGKQ